jgi:hypothetical protein
MGGQDFITPVGKITTISSIYSLRSMRMSIIGPSNRSRQPSSPHSLFICLSLQEDLTPLHIACDNENIKIVSLLLESGADPNIFVKISSVSAGSRNSSSLDSGLQEKWWSPLRIACRRRNSEIVSLLLSRGADPNLQDLVRPAPSLPCFLRFG